MKKNKKNLARGLIGELYENDAWVRAFMDECFLMWGLPCSSIQCISQKDRTMFAWGMLHLVQALTIDKDIWWGMRDKIEPSKAAWEFSRRLWENGVDLIPSVPESEVPDNVKRLALPPTVKLSGSDTPVSGSSTS